MSLPWKITGDEINEISKLVPFELDGLLEEEEEKEEEEEVEVEETETETEDEGGEEEAPEIEAEEPAEVPAEIEGPPSEEAEELAEADCHTAMIGCMADKCDFHNAEVNMCTRDDIKVDERGGCMFYKSVGMEQADEEVAEEEGPEGATDIAPIETPPEAYEGEMGEEVDEFMEPQGGEITTADLEQVVQDDEEEEEEEVEEY